MFHDCLNDAAVPKRRSGFLRYTLAILKSSVLVFKIVCVKNNESEKETGYGILKKLATPLTLYVPLTPFDDFEKFASFRRQKF